MVCVRQTSLVRVRTLLAVAEKPMCVFEAIAYGRCSCT
jgi:hypothetical protein